MRLDDLLNFWKNEPDIHDAITHWQTTPNSYGKFVDFPASIDPRIQASLKSQQIYQLYQHQFDAYEIVQEGKNLVIVTGTASGKTMSYALPIAQSMLDNPDATALCIFPTKALAQDQKVGFDQLFSFEQETTYAHVYDGDTPQNQRQKIRQNARILLTNPDMLQIGILPYHTKWASFFQNLKYVVIDECHIYRGVFGSHVANVIRRLKRIAAYYGASPQFILTSATIGNPSQHASNLIEAPVELINRDFAPHGQRHFLLYNPPIIDEKFGLRASSINESVRLTSDLLAYGIQTLFFVVTRRTTEIALTYLRDRFPGRNNEIRGYRAGFLPKERREIEKGLKQGTIRAVISTNALELGVDIGGMDAVVINGYPGTIASVHQQSGRAGRRDEDALSIMVLNANPINQYFASHPQFLLEKSPEVALIDPNNLEILISHLVASIYEKPFSTQEGFGALSSQDLQQIFDFLDAKGEILRSQGETHYIGVEFPAGLLSLRSSSLNTVLLQANIEGQNKVIGKVDADSAKWMVHPGAIYLHESASYFVEKLDLQEGIALLTPVDVDFYTQTIRESEVTLLDIDQKAIIPAGNKYYGDLQITSQVTGFKRIEWYSREVLSVEDLNMPPDILTTTGYWFVFDADKIQALLSAGNILAYRNDYGSMWSNLKQIVRQRDNYTCQICGAKEDGKAHDVHHRIPFKQFTTVEEANQLTNLTTLCRTCHLRVEMNVRVRSGLSGLGYLLHNLAPLFVMCDINDIFVVVEHEAKFADGLPAIVFYEEVAGGIGLTKQLYQVHDQLLQTAYDVVTTCPCEDGCPSCVGPGGENGQGGKQEAIALLRSLLGN